jgi:hypothetical protein
LGWLIELALDRGRASRFKYEKFNSFVPSPPSDGGLGTTIELLIKLLDEYEDEKRMVVLARMVPAGNPTGANPYPATPAATQEGEGIVGIANNLCPQPRAGMNDVPYAIRRLSRERPDLVARVTAKELSWNARVPLAAAIRAVSVLVERGGRGRVFETPFASG